MRISKFSSFVIILGESFEKIESNEFAVIIAIFGLSPEAEVI